MKALEQIVNDLHPGTPLRGRQLRPAPPSTLDEILSPIPYTDFLSCYLRKEFCHIPGDRGRFRLLLPWTTLSQILHEHRLDYPRLRLIRNGETLPPQSYIDYLTDRRGARYTRVRADGLENELVRGAMLHLAAVDELNPELARLAESISSKLKTTVMVNVCAGTHNSRGFATHWDGHDVLVLQVHGRKHWRIYGITQPSPLRIGVGMDAGPQTDKPTVPVWEGTIEEGDLIYLPRGCWHSAEGTADPTLHLTVGIINPTGHDFLTWIRDTLLEEEVFRADLPDLDAPAVKAQHVEALRTALASKCTVQAMEQFLALTHEKRTSRRRVTFPTSDTNADASDPKMGIKLT